MFLETVAVLTVSLMVISVLAGPLVVLSVLTILLVALLVLATHWIRFQRCLLYLHWLKPYSWFQGIPEKSSQHDTVHLRAADGVELQMWRWGPDRESKGGVAVLYFHGNAETRAFPKRRQQYENVRQLFLGLKGDLPVTVYVLEYRGFGDSSASPSQEGLLEDAKIAFRYVKDIQEAKHVYLWGQSMGSGVAALLARRLSANRNAYDKPSVHSFDQLILEAPFRSIAHAALNHWVGYPLRLVPSFVREYILRRIEDKFQTEIHLKEMLKEIKVPIIFLHGRQDWVISHQQSATMVANLREAFPTRTIDFFSFPHAGHTSCTFQEDFLSVREKLA